jgi:hypothetical protein
MVYLAKKNGVVVHHTDKKAMREFDGIEKADVEITDAEFEAANGLLRIINGKIVIGKTAEEKAEDARQVKIDGYKAELAQIDRDAGAVRCVRGLALAAAQKSGITSGKDYGNLKDFEDRADVLREKIKAEEA